MAATNWSIAASNPAPALVLPGEKLIFVRLV
jgi:hypothetical protein